MIISNPFFPGVEKIKNCSESICITQHRQKLKLLYFRKEYTAIELKLNFRIFTWSQVLKTVFTVTPTPTIKIRTQNVLQ